MSSPPPVTGHPRGLATDEARSRLESAGPNRVREPERATLLRTFLEEIREPMIVLLLATGGLYAVWGEPVDAATIFAVILVLVGVEVANEWRAERAIAALHELAEPTSTVLRDGRPVEIPVAEVVPGDVLLLRAGRRVPADAVLVEAHGLAADESALTGESVPVDKDAGSASDADAALAERDTAGVAEPLSEPIAAVFAGSTITRGRGVAVVRRTGGATELGRIAAMTTEATAPRTPLQMAMSDLTRYLVIVALGVSVLVPLLALLIGSGTPREMLLVGLTLAFATIPEELPIVITMVLGLGGYRLAKHRAIVRRLSAIETLGAVTLIATDKTGTLTENRMEVAEIEPRDLARRVVEIGALTSGDPGEQSDPMDEALLDAAVAHGIDVTALRAGWPARAERPFDEERRLMTVLCEGGDGVRAVVRGAPEAVLMRSTRRWTARGEHAMSDEARVRVLEAAAGMAARGLRVIALAERVHDRRAPIPPGPESDLVFAGLVGLADPPRPEVHAAIAECRAAGIRTVIVSGDHPLTVHAVGQLIGLDGTGPVVTGSDIDAMSDQELGVALERASLFARTSAAHKLRIVRSAQERGACVVVTGDGVNDAPALATADVGVAMGRTGTDVARETADVVLADDDFATLAEAVREGRVLFANLRKGVRYYLACKVALVASMFLPALLAAPLPFVPVQIILMELFMDLAASAAFVAEPAEPGLMRRPPRDSRAPFMDRTMIETILVAGAGLFVAVGVAYLTTWYATGLARTAGTVAFVTWLLGHFLLAVNLRSDREPLVRIGLLANRVMTAWGAVTVAFVLAAVLAPGLHDALKTTSLTLGQWTLAITAAIAGTCWMEVVKWTRRTTS